MDAQRTEFINRVDALDHKGKLFLLAFCYAIGHEPVSEDDVSYLRESISAPEWRDHLHLLERERAEMPRMTDSINKASRFIRERILMEVCA